MVIQKKSLLIFSAGCLVVLLTVFCSYANAGIPIVTLQIPFMLSLVVPVVVIEGVLLRQALALIV